MRGRHAVRVTEYCDTALIVLVETADLPSSVAFDPTRTSRVDGGFAAVHLARHKTPSWASLPRVSVV